MSECFHSFVSPLNSALALCLMSLKLQCRKVSGNNHPSLISSLLLERGYPGPVTSCILNPRKAQQPNVYALCLYGRMS